MSKDWWYVSRHPDLDGNRTSIARMLDQQKEVSWLPKLPIDSILSRLKEEFPGVIRNGSELDLFWCSDFVGLEDDIVKEYGRIPTSRWSGGDEQSFELCLHERYVQFSGTGVSDEVAKILDKIFLEFNCIPIS
ncbi:MAG: hypothetical protein AB7W16_10560 [Candidatus Obscuribacterales bacterium]